MVLSSGNQVYVTPPQPDYGSPAPPTEHLPMEPARASWEQSLGPGQLPQPHPWLLAQANNFANKVDHYYMKLI